MLNDDHWVILQGLLVLHLSIASFIALGVD